MAEEVQVQKPASHRLRAIFSKLPEGVRALRRDRPEGFIISDTTGEQRFCEGSRRRNLYS